MTGGTFLKSHIRKAGGIAAALYGVCFFELPALAAEHAAEHAEGHESTGGLPQFDATTFASQLFWLAITFTILYVLFGRWILPSLTKTLETRSNLVNGDLRAAESMKAEAEKMRQTYEKSLAESRAESTRLMAEAEAAIKQSSEKAIKAFQDKATQEIAATEARLAKARDKALKEVEPVAAAIASEAAARIVGVKTDIKQAETVVQALNKKEAA